MDPVVKVQLLGPFSVSLLGGESLELSGKKLQALVGYLAIEHKRMHSRDALAALLWGDMGDERARHNLRQALSKLRRCVPQAELVVSDGDCLRLNTEQCDVDAHAFWEASVAQDVESRREALRLYHGDVLDGLVVREDPFDDWLANTRREYRLRACAALQSVADIALGRGELDSAIEFYRQKLALDPCAEPAHRGLIEALAKSGRRSEALQQYQTCVETLRVQLDMEPSADTQSLFARIKSSPEAFKQPALDETPLSVVEPPPGTSNRPEPPSVAVLPFDNLNATPDEDYFGDGITEDLIMALSRFGTLTVIARTSSFAYRGRELPLDQIGRELEAEFIVTGSVRRAGNRVRINVQLLEAKSSKHLWAQRFDREMEDIFVVQDEVTETVVSTLVGRMEVALVDRARPTASERLDAYDCLLRGKDMHHRYTLDGCNASMQLLQQAVSKDPDYALAHAWLACAYGLAMTFYPKERALYLDKAQQCCERALELDPDESECHRILAQVYMLRHDMTKSMHHQERAILLNPNDDRIVVSMGEILVCYGNPAEAIDWVKRAMRLNPYHSPNYWFHLARAQFHSGQPEDALESLGRVPKPSLRDCALAAAAAAEAGDAERARKAVEAVRGMKADFDPERFLRRLAYARESDRQQWLAGMRRAGL